MNQITIRQLVRQGNKEKIQSWLPFEIVSDGEVIATVHDVRQTTNVSTKSDKLIELPFSKKRQAEGRL